MPPRKLLFVITSLVLAAVLGACTAGNSTSPTPERKVIKVGALPLIDCLPLRLAAEKGLFAKEGLDVQVVDVTSAPAAMPGLLGGQFDTLCVPYPAVITAQAKHMADLRIVSEAYQTSKRASMLMAAPGSALKSPADLPGKKIAVAGRGSLSDLAVMSAAKTLGLDVGSINFVNMSLPDMIPAMAKHEVDGAVVGEPFTTMAAAKIGASPVYDLATGPTADFPQSGWITTATFAHQNPATVTDFQRAMVQAQNDAERNPIEVQHAMSKYLGIDTQTAALVTIANYPSRPDASRLQRVADILQEFGIIQQHFDVSTMIIRPRD